jgi:hypothetical protein
MVGNEVGLDAMKHFQTTLTNQTSQTISNHFQPFQTTSNDLTTSNYPKNETQLNSNPATFAGLAYLAIDGRCFGRTISAGSALYR